MATQIQGRVFEEFSERGLSGVLVSNGEDIVRTDAEGWNHSMGAEASD